MGLNRDCSFIPDIAMIIASACAKVILFGEHAVVYQQPAIAVPISSLRVTVTAEDTPKGFCLVAQNLDNQRFFADDTNNPFVQLALRICQYYDMPLPAYTLTIDSAIPIASGLGSGAAIATALARAIVTILGVSPSLTELNAFVYETEKTYHGTPSGIDNTVIVYEKPIYFIREKPIQIIQTFAPFSLLVANTGISAPTKESVADVRKLYESDRQVYGALFNEIGTIANNGLKAMQTADWVKFGQLMTHNHHILQQLTVSSPQLDCLVDTALSSGAIGAKLSGGGRGGNMIVLVEGVNSTPIKEALLKNGAVHVFETRVQA
jgi:mevalonate kinase